MFPIPGEDIIYSWYTIAVALVFGSFLGFRNYMRGPQCMSKVSLKNKTVIVTGANRGIGLETARELAMRGAKVILACRDEASAAQAIVDIKLSQQKCEVEFMPLDLSSLKSVREFVTAFKAKNDHLEILVNNAAVMYHPDTHTAEGHETHFAVNYLGHFLLTHLLVDMLKESAPARIINIMCPAYQLAEPDFTDVKCEERQHKPADAYALSKLAVALWTKQLSRELEGSNVTCNMIYPGLCYTNLYKDMPFMQSKLIAITFGPVMWYLMKGCRDGAQTVIHCAIATEEEGVSGKYYADLRIQNANEKVDDEASARLLWEQSLQWIKPTESIDS